MVTNFETYLRKSDLSENTIRSYLWTINYFFSQYEKVNSKSLLAYKEWLLRKFKPQTINLRLQAINKYLEFARKFDMRLKPVRVQQKSFIENVISNADYRYLKTMLKKDGLEEWYFVVWYMTATGARVSELIQIKAEHVVAGYLDLYTKGGKIRRIYIPKTLCRESLEWLSRKSINSGYIFQNRYGERITTRGVGVRLKDFAYKYGLNPNVVYPHSFRHRFAMNFLEKFNDLALLADLMGHENIETTRIYLRRTSSEQRAIVDRIVTW